MKFTLEQQKFFPYIAWSLIIFFVGFTYMLSMRLLDSASAGTLEAHKERNVSALKGEL